MNFFYQEVSLLNREQHKNLKLKQSGDCSFAKCMHLVPLTALEFFQAAHHYPIVFVGEGEKAIPMALLGLQQNVNSFIKDDNLWQDDTYIPAFVRRYPFVLAETQAENFTVCFDAAYPGWDEKEGMALFDDQGKNTEFLDEMVQFLQNFSDEMNRTRRFVTRLNELQLLHSSTIQLTHSSGETFVLYDFNVVDEEKFLQLNDEQILDLHKKGFLGIIYAHLMSQNNVSQLFSRYLADRNASESVAADEPTNEMKGNSAEKEIDKIIPQ